MLRMQPSERRLIHPKRLKVKVVKASQQTGAVLTAAGKGKKRIR